MTYLVVLVEPEEGQVGNPDRLPMVLYLFTCAIYDVGNFICDHELQVLHETHPRFRFMKKGNDALPALVNSYEDQMTARLLTQIEWQK